MRRRWLTALAVILLITAGLMAGGDHVLTQVATRISGAWTLVGGEDGATHDASRGRAFTEDGADVPQATALSTVADDRDAVLPTAGHDDPADAYHRTQPAVPPGSQAPRQFPVPSAEALHAAIAAAEQPPTAGRDSGSHGPEHAARPPRKLDLNPWQEVRFSDPAAAYAFDFDPRATPDGKIRFDVPVDGPQCVIEVVNVPQQAQIRLDGQIIEPGKRYLVQPGAVLQGSSPMGVHLRPITPGEVLDRPSGPG